MISCRKRRTLYINSTQWTYLHLWGGRGWGTDGFERNRSLCAAADRSNPTMSSRCSVQPDRPLPESGGLSAGAQRRWQRSREPDLCEQEPPEPGADGSGCEGPGLEDQLAPPEVLPQVGVFSHPAPCDSRGVLQHLTCAGAFLLDQGVGGEEGAGFHLLRGSMSGCGRGACTPLPAGRHHQDGLQGDSLDVPLRRCSILQDSNERGRNNPQWTQTEIHRDMTLWFICLICYVQMSSIPHSALLWIITLLILRKLIAVKGNIKRMERRFACPCVSHLDKMFLNRSGSPLLCYLNKKQAGWFESSHLFFTHSACCKRERCRRWRMCKTRHRDGDKIISFFVCVNLIIIQCDIGSGSGNSVCCGIIKCMFS